ncbi:MAG: proteasome subunit beta [Actinomycetota bacterium]|jgi:proteasome beta subunit|nr:proteasome subunit beta [Actinomycetota bacterium]
MSDLSLPSFASGVDPGPSFAELLRRVQPEAWPPALTTSQPVGGGPSARLDVPHGTTIACVRYAGGVVMAGDRRATEGYTIASRRMDKVMAADHWSGVAIAGAAGPAMEMVRLFQTELEHYEKVEGEPLSLEGKANKLSQMIRANLPAAMQGMVVVPLFAGYDLRRSDGRLFKYDVTGGRYEEADYATTGSGGVHARNWIKAGYRPGMERNEAVDLCLLALFQAADEDSATGGPDLVRRIYPSVATIDGEGFALLSDDAVEGRSTDLLQGRAAQ